ncbi:MAG: hypothetical protein R3C24_10115 [Cyanobacteriota/Melainabacteria group bacterium]
MLSCAGLLTNRSRLILFKGAFKIAWINKSTIDAIISHSNWGMFMHQSMVRCMQIPRPDIVAKLQYSNEKKSCPPITGVIR